MDWTSALFEELETEGFALKGLVDIDRVEEAAWRQHTSRYDDWIKTGMHGAMEYLVRGRDRRADPRLVFPEAKSVLCVGMAYPARPAGSRDARKGPRYAAYLRGGDYHEIIRAKMEAALGRFRDGHIAKTNEAPHWKVCVDTSAVLERAWGALSGIGWIGKNKMLLHPRLGSYFFIGTAFLSLESGRDPSPMPGYCGHCTRCLDGCPTGAFGPDGMLDSRRCISYLTLEKRGPHTDTPETVLAATGAWVAGCDVCQEVCPFNRRRMAAEAGMNCDDGPTALADWDSLLAETEEQYRARVKDTALSRIKPADFARNLELARKHREDATPPLT